MILNTNDIRVSTYDSPRYRSREQKEHTQFSVVHQFTFCFSVEESRKNLTYHDSNEIMKSKHNDIYDGLNCKRIKRIISDKYYITISLIVGSFTSSKITLIVKQWLYA